MQVGAGPGVGPGLAPVLRDSHLKGPYTEDIFTAMKYKQDTSLLFKYKF